MNLNERFDVSEAKIQELKARIQRLGVNLALVEEAFIKGGGKGGQKINKTANCVQLHYPPMGISVRVQKDRKRTINRFLALRELVDQIEMKVSPETSKRLQEIKKIRKRKSRSQQRSAQKYQGSDAAPKSLS